jgi:hypothetical protein
MPGREAFQATDPERNISAGLTRETWNPISLWWMIGNRSCLSNSYQMSHPRDCTIWKVRFDWFGGNCSTCLIFIAAVLIISWIIPRSGWIMPEPECQEGPKSTQTWKPVFRSLSVHGCSARRCSDFCFNARWGMFTSVDHFNLGGQSPSSTYIGIFETDRKRDMVSPAWSGALSIWNGTGNT